MSKSLNAINPVCGQLEYEILGNKICILENGHQGEHKFVDHQCHDCGVRHGTCRCCGTTHGDNHSPQCLYNNEQIFRSCMD
jgi:hypothetical protein